MAEPFAHSREVAPIPVAAIEEIQYEQRAADGPNEEVQEKDETALDRRHVRHGRRGGV